jgi:hypothetical protein
MLSIALLAIDHLRRQPEALFSQAHTIVAIAAMQPSIRANLLRCHIFYRPVAHTPLRRLTSALV